MTSKNEYTIVFTHSLTTSASAYSKPERFDDASASPRQITWKDVERDLQRQHRVMRDNNLYTATDAAYRELYERGLLKLQ